MFSNLKDVEEDPLVPLPVERDEPLVLEGWSAWGATIVEENYNDDSLKKDKRHDRRESIRGASTSGHSATSSYPANLRYHEEATPSARYVRILHKLGGNMGL